MKTEISRFCEACSQSLQALPEELTMAAARMEKVEDPALIRNSFNTLNDLRARLRSLTDKLGSQQAYLLIFGPLKSGKSTLMNAISGAYVSEVTSLPGYPCLVFVQHASDQHFSVTRYNGRESVFTDTGVLKDVISDGHFALAEQIRVTERRGESFDPRSHFTEAIRRVDIKVPVESLRESSTVLVDTPGLYSRMNFGYDVITREFRNSAACAVFVVKTDNLFLEQVFAEFNQLLGLFSRIFLVINVDSSKRDLQPDGSLQPSAESQNPDQILEAFKTLSMAGPLRDAYEQGRVRIHAVDLLNAASSFLTKDENGNGNGNGPDKQRTAFDAFMRDLADYLNSSDYTREFIGDSLRQGHSLCAEARAICENAEFDQVRLQQEQLRDHIAVIDSKIASVDRLLKVDWDATFEMARVEHQRRSDEAITAQTARLTKEMRESLDQWYGASESLKSLLDDRWNLLIGAAARALAEGTRDRLGRILNTPFGGAEPAAIVMSELHAVSFDLAPSARAAAPALNPDDAISSYCMSIDPASIPVRKSIADWLLFRRIATVRRRLFGEDLSQDIAPEVKQKRLPEISRAALLQAMEDAVKPAFSTLPSRYAQSLLLDYIGKFRTSVLVGLQKRRGELEAERAARQRPFDANSQLLDSLQQLRDQTTQIARELESLAEVENVALTPLVFEDAETLASIDLAEATVIPETATA
jgi:Dynamin family